MDPNYGRAYRELFEKHWWWRAREDVIVQTLQRYRPQQGWPDILDVGCGDGLFFDRLGEFGDRVEGVEPGADLVTRANGHAGQIHLTTFDRGFQPGKRYGLILMLDVLEHIEAPDEALGRVVELLAPGGLFIATVPAFQALWTRHDDVNHHFVRYTKPSLRHAVQRAGLRVLQMEYFFHWTFPAKLLVRLAQRVLPVRDPVERVPPPLINNSLLALSRAERYALRGKLPLGSSLIAVCRSAKDAR